MKSLLHAALTKASRGSVTTLGGSTPKPMSGKTGNLSSAYVIVGPRSVTPTSSSLGIAQAASRNISIKYRRQKVVFYKNSQLKSEKESTFEN